MLNEQSYLPKVRNQYESYPYPFREPEAEKEKLLTTELDRLEKINYYCYEGKKTFEGFNVLVAGCGTGDSVIYLAEQLLGIAGAKVVALDMSEASLNVAKERAAIRQLDNIEWIHDSLLNLASLLDEGRFERFDFINCSGVLHHLSDPDEGLKALHSVLKPEGVLAIMVYAECGRTGVYQMQNLMRMINCYQPDMEEQVDNTKQVLNVLPATNWWKKNEHLIYDVRKFGDIGIYDLFLHSQDRAYTIPELYEFISKINFDIIAFPGWRDRMALDPVSYLSGSPVLDKINELPKIQRQAIAELIGGFVVKHVFYAAANAGKQASFGDLDMVPFFYGFLDCEAHEVFYRQLKEDPKNTKPIKAQNLSFNFEPGKYTKNIIQFLDGKRSWKEIFDKVREVTGKKDISDQEFLNDFKPIFEFFESIDGMLLRAKNVPEFKSSHDIQERVRAYYV